MGASHDGRALDARRQLEDLAELREQVLLDVGVLCALDALLDRLVRRERRPAPTHEEEGARLSPFASGAAPASTCICMCACMRMRAPVQLALAELREESHEPGAGRHRAAALGQQRRVVLDDRAPDRPPGVARRAVVDELPPQRAVDAVRADHKVKVGDERLRRRVRGVRGVLKGRRHAAARLWRDVREAAVEVDAVFGQARREDALQLRPPHVEHRLAVHRRKARRVTRRVGQLREPVGRRHLDGGRRAAHLLDVWDQLCVDSLQGREAVGPQREAGARLRREGLCPLVDVGVDADLAQGVAAGEPAQAAADDGGLERGCEG